MVQVRGYSEDDVDVLSDELAFLIVESLTRAVTKTADQLKPALTAASSAGIGPSDIGVLTEYWQAEVDGVLTPYVSQVYTGSAVSVAVGLADGFPLDANPGIPLLPDDFTQTFLKTVVGDFVSVGDDVWEDVREVLVQGVKNGESIEQIAAKMKYVTSFSTKRAEEIARTVTHAAAESGSIAQLRFVGYAGDEVIKEWVATHDARTRPTHARADNQRVNLDEKFTVGSTSLDFPGDPSGARSETIYCRCTVVFEIDDAPKLRCSGVTAATTATQCVVPTPQVDISGIPVDTQNEIFNSFMSHHITAAWGGAKIHKVLQAVKQDTGTSLDEFTMLAIVDSIKIGKSGDFTPKYHQWIESAAGKKAAPNVKPPATHGVAPISPSSTLPTPVDPFAPPRLPPVAPKPDASEITFTGKTLGSHGAQVWVNPTTGERWLFKPQAQFATDIDIATSRIQSKALEMRPGVYPMTLNGKSGSIQYMFESKEAWPGGSFDPLKLTHAEIATLQQGHIFDWLISNFDTHSGQWIRLSDGSLFGTDKGQAFKFFGSDKLDWDYVPVTPLGLDKLTYQAMWRAYVQGKDVDIQDPTTGPLGEYIDRLMAIPDDEYRAILTAYAQFKPNPTAFLAQAVARKNSLKKDFAEFWARAQAERAKHVKVAPPAPTPTPPPIKLPGGSAAADGDISGFDYFAKQDVMDAWIHANNGVKVTPAWGGSKIWKILDDVKSVLQLSYAVHSLPAPSHLQILRILDDVSGFKGKSKSYESVLLQWLDTPAGKKAVPHPPKSLKPATTATPSPAVPKPTPVVAPSATMTPVSSPTPLAATSKFPGKVPGDTVTTAEIDSVKYLFGDGDIVAEGKVYATGVNQLISDGKGGLTLVHQPTGGYKYLAGKHYPATAPLPKSISGTSQWKVGPSAITQVKPSLFPGKNAGDVITQKDMAGVSSGTAPHIPIAYSYDASFGLEYQITENFGMLTLRSRTVNTNVWTVVGDQFTQTFDDVFKKLTWYAATDKGDMPDVVKVQLPKTTGKPAGSNVPSNIPGKNFGDPITETDVVYAPTHVPGTILAEAMDYGGNTELRILVDANGTLIWQTRVKGSDWKDSKIPFSAFFNSADSKGWYASVGKISATAMKATPPTPTKFLLAGQQTHIPGKNVGDSITTGEIFAAKDLYVDGQVIATKKTWEGLYRYFMADGKLIQQKQSKGGAWIQSTIIDHQWQLYGSLKASNDVITKLHLNHAKKFVATKTAGVPAKPKKSSPKATTSYVPPPAVPFVPRPIDLSPWSAVDRTVIYQTLHAKNVKSYLGASEIWDRVKSTHADLIKSDAKYTQLDVVTILRIYDAERAKAAGVVDTHPLEAKVITWLQTPAGKIHAAKSITAPVLANDIPKPMHALDDPSNPPPSTQKYERLTNQELIVERSASHARYGGWVGQQKSALRTYTGGSYSSWNAAIRLGDISAHRAKIIAAQQAMRPSTRPMLLIRKASFAEFNDPTIQNIDDLKARVGQRFVTRGFSSTSNTGTWSGTVRFEIECPIGTPMARVQDFSHYPSENETTLPAHLIYEIRSVKPDAAGGTKVRVRVVGAYDPKVGSW